MNLNIVRCADVEKIIADDLRAYFQEDIDFASLFPRDQVKVSSDHPFVNLMNQEVSEGGKYNLSCLPAVTVIDTQFVKLIDTPVAPQTMRILPALVDEIKKYGRDQFTISKQTLAALVDSFKTEDHLLAEGYETWRKTSIAIEVWANNNVVKGKLFDLVTLYLAGARRFALHTEQDIMIEEETVTGEKSGIYNFDFGEVLYGSMIRFTVGYKVGAYQVKNFEIGKSVVIQNDALID
jgi:hypothetical protein